MHQHIYQDLVQAKKLGQKKFAVLIDPDSLRVSKLEKILELGAEGYIDYFFIGGSLIVNDMLDEVLVRMKKASDVPLILFPGNTFQISSQADALLFLSLISGRNAELLIGQHVVSAPYLKLSPLEIISTGYMLIDGGVPTTVSYMSNTNPIPSDKEDIAVCTAMAGEMLGLKILFMDAGSGAKTPVSSNMIDAVSRSIGIPLIVGGGIRTPEKAYQNVCSGADMIVVGNAIEKNPSLIKEIGQAVHKEISTVQ
jgi:putative glycerol-1-phosphate prenyltransferase